MGLLRIPQESHRISTGFLREYIGFLWDSHRIPIGFLGIPWESLRDLMGLRRNPQEALRISIGFLGSLWDS
eukprot:5295912-Pyramimonas_sp.AAC.1